MPGLGGTYSFGHYSATYNAANIGETEGPKRLQIAAAVKPIFTDKYGDVQIDGIYTGGAAFVMLVLKEWSAAVRTAIWPFGTFGNVGTPGKRVTDLCYPLVLTALAGTPAASVGPASLTFPLACPAEGNNMEILLGNDQRNVPILFRCYPDSNGAWWT